MGSNRLKMIVVSIIKFLFCYNNLNATNYAQHYFLPLWDLIKVSLNEKFLMTFKKVD
jgi:hypothetical protein